MKRRDTEWLTASEAAHYLKVRTRTLLLWTRQGKVLGYALSGTKRRVWRYRREDLDHALLSHGVIGSASANCALE
jgi:excisionase family DNA binding protein